MSDQTHLFAALNLAEQLHAELTKLLPSQAAEMPEGVVAVGPGTVTAIDHPEFPLSGQARVTFVTDDGKTYTFTFFSLTSAVSLGTRYRELDVLIQWPAAFDRLFAVKPFPAPIG